MSDQEIDIDSQQALSGFSPLMRFESVDWKKLKNEPGVYLIYDEDELVYVGSSGQLGKRLKDHSTGNIVQMFPQYLFLNRVQFVTTDRIRHPRDARSVCFEYICKHCAFRCMGTPSKHEAEEIERRLKALLRPTLNYQDRDGD